MHLRSSLHPCYPGQLKLAAASDDGAHRAAELLLDSRLQVDTARTALLDGLCSLTRRARQTDGAHLVSSVFRRLLATMPLRQLVILLGRLLPLLQSTAVPGVPLLQTSGRSASGKPAASLMHTMARLTGHQYWITSHARSAHALLTPVACVSSTSSSNRPSPTSTLE